jgi:tryptophanyl-tRNA synthetase
MGRSLLALLLIALAAAPAAADDSLASKFGSKRVKVKTIKAETPQQVYELKLAAARTKADQERKECEYTSSAGNGREYCKRQADEQFNDTQKKLREDLRKAEAEAGGDD